MHGTARYYNTYIDGSLECGFSPLYLNAFSCLCFKSCLTFLFQLEQFVDEAQKKFDVQYELCREVLEDRDQQNAAMVVHLEDLCKVQVEYFKEAHELAMEMEKKVLGRP